MKSVPGKSILIPAPSQESAVFMTRTTYVSATGESLLQEYSELVASDTFGKFRVRRSEDNGKNWSPPALTAEPVRVSGGILRRSGFTFLLDEKTNRLFRFYNLSVYPDLKGYTSEVARTFQIWFEISEDGGKTFAEPRQLVVQGCDPAAWSPDVCYGINGSAISFSQAFVREDGGIVLPAQWTPPLAPGHTGPYPLEVLCYIGENREDGSILWKASERVSIDSSRSVRGLCEPTIAPLKDGRLLMLARGSNVQHPAMPAHKWMTLSADGGLHWEPVRPFGYDTGDLLHSPATGSRLIRASRSGKLYWIGNISPHNAEGNGPRYPLCIGEVNEETLTLRKDTVRDIDTRRAEDTPKVQLSNFHVYEDRVTGEFVLIMSRIFERSETSLVSPAYEYRFLPHASC